MLKTILVAYNGSESAEKAFDFAIEQAKTFHATAFVLAVVDQPFVPTAIEMAGFLESERSFFSRAMGRLREKAEEAGIALEVRISEGRPAHEIIREANCRKADLLVMGRPRQTGRIARWLSGSILNRVLNSSPCSIAVVGEDGCEIKEGCRDAKRKSTSDFSSSHCHCDMPSIRRLQTRGR